MEGPDHPDVSYAYHNLGRVLNEQGEAEQALESYRKALEVRERALGPDHPAVSHILHSYSIALAISGDVDRAAELEERNIRLAEATFGPGHRNTLDAMEVQAQLRALQGRHDEAIAMLETLVERGWANLTAMEGSPFAETAKDPRFGRLLEAVRKAQQKD